MSFYQKIKAIYPKSYVSWVKKNLEYADIKVSIEKFVATEFLYSLSLAISVALTLYTLKFSTFLILIASFGIFLAFQIIPNVMVILIADKRAKFAEEVLPDVLQLTAANLRAGLTPDRALMLAARPEFGLLEDEIRVAAKKAVAGTPIEEAIVGIGKRIKSKLISRTLTLITEGIRKGGEIAGLLEQTAEDIRNTKLLKKEVAAQVTMYAIFIFMAAGLIAPLLYSISTYLVETMIKIGAAAGVEEAIAKYGRSMGFISFKLVEFPPGFLTYYAIGAMAITSFFGSLLIGLLKEGSEKAGIKFIPIFLILNLIIFFSAKTLIEQFMVGVAPVILPK
jgi:flagellar protein FlaJ